MRKFARRSVAGQISRIMKTLLLFRHGKSDWGADYSHDHDRPLAPRGRRAAASMGAWMADTGPEPDLILCSTALRARKTCELAIAAGRLRVPVRLERGLYGATCDDLLHFMKSTHNEVNTLMLIGHQPTWSETASLLSKAPIGHFPTAAMACVELFTDHWKDAAFGQGRLLWLRVPADLPSEYVR